MPLTKRDNDNLQRSYRIEDRTCWKIANDLVHKKKADNDDFIILEMMSLVQSHYLRKGSPDQPRDDHGRWTSGGGSGSFNDETVDTTTDSSDDVSNADASDGGDNPQQGVEGDSIDVAGGFEGVDLSQSVSDFVSSSCKGHIRREIPGEFLDLSLGDFLKKKGAAAHKCYKLINEDRFRK